MTRTIEKPVSYLVELQDFDNWNLWVRGVMLKQERGEIYFGRPGNLCRKDAYTGSHDDIVVLELRYRGHVNVEQLKVVDGHLLVERDDGAIDGAKDDETSSAQAEFDV